MNYFAVGLVVVLVALIAWAIVKNSGGSGTYTQEDDGWELPDDPEDIDRGDLPDRDDV